MRKASSPATRSQNDCTEMGNLTMAELPLPWRAYAALQSNLDTRLSVDPTSWGLEAGLNHLLDGEALRTDGADVDRIVANAARRDRHARSLQAKHIIIGTEVHEDAGQIEARSTLALLHRQIPQEKLDLLVELASGADTAQVAASRGVPVGALRTRAARLRHIAREMAA